MAQTDDIVESGNVFEDLGHPRPAEALARPARAQDCALIVDAAVQAHLLVGSN
jgi:hypothetical protein